MLHVSMLITIILVAKISGMRQHTRRQFEAQWLRVTMADNAWNGIRIGMTVIFKSTVLCGSGA